MRGRGNRGEPPQEPSALEEGGFLGVAGSSPCSPYCLGLVVVRTKRRHGSAQPNPSLNSDPACIAFRSLSASRFLGFVQRLGAGGAG